MIADKFRKYKVELYQRTCKHKGGQKIEAHNSQKVPKSFQGASIRLLSDIPKINNFFQEVHTQEEMMS